MSGLYEDGGSGGGGKNGELHQCPAEMVFVARVTTFDTLCGSPRWAKNG